MTKKKSIIKPKLAENYFSSILENVPNLILIVNAEGKISFASPSIKRILGFDVEEVLGTSAFRFVHPEFIEKTKAEYSELLSNPEIIQNILLKVIKKDGSIGFIRGSRRNLLENNEINGIILTVQDVTQRFFLEQESERTKELLNAVEGISKVGGWEWDIKSQKMSWTKETYLIHEINPDFVFTNSNEHLEKSISCYGSKDRVLISEAFNNCVVNGTPYDLECLFTTFKGTNLWVRTIGQPIYENNEVTKVFGNIVDITTAKREKLLDEARIKLVQFSYKSTLDEFIQNFLDETERLTDSKIGFYHFVNDDQENLTLQIWSTNTLKTMCTAQGKGLHYKISDAGVWVECFYSRKPVIHNDYKNLANKKGMPEGHAVVTRELTIPLIRNDKVVAILGVGNKETDYTNEDVEFVTKFADLAWDITERKRLFEMLEESENKYRTLFNNANETISIVQDGIIKLTNPNFYNLTGYTLEEISQINVFDIIHPDDREKLINFAYKRQRSERTENEYVFRLINKNNSIKWVNRKLSYIVWEGRAAQLFIDNDITEIKNREEKIKLLHEQESQKIIELNANNLDLQKARISTLNILDDLSLENEERKKVEKLLLESEQRYRMLANNSPMPVIVVSLADGNLLFANKSAYKLMGAVNNPKSINEYFAKDFYAVPQKRFEFLETLKNEGRVSSFEADVKTLDKSVITVLISAIITTFENEQAIFSSFYDITDRIKAEASLRESELRFQHVAEATGDWIWEVDENGLYTYSSNVCFDMLGYKPDEIVGKKYFYDFFKNENKDRSKNIAFDMFSRKETFKHLNNLVIHKNGSEIFLSTSGKPIVDNNGNLIGYRGADKNISHRKKAELALRESEAKFRSIVTNTEEILFMIDNNGIFTLSEGKGLAAIGLKPGQVVGLSAYDVYKDLPEVIKGIKIALLGENTFLDKITVGNVYFNVWYSPNKNDNGDILGAIGMAVNITQQVNAEKALSQSEEKFRKIFDNHSAIKLLIDPETGNIIDANNAASEFYGWSIDELKTMKIYQINTLPTEITKQEMNNVINKTKGQFNFKHRLANGEVRDVEAFSSLINVGEKQFLHSIIHDITERRKVENELQKRSLAIDQSPASIVITDLDGNIEYVNPKFTQVTGYSNHEALGQNPRVLKSGKQPNEFYKELWDTILTGSNWSGVFHNQRKNGELFWESAIISPVKNEDGKITNFVAIKEDITEKVVNDLELKKYRENLEELVALRTKELDVINEELISQLEKGKQLEIQLAESLSKEKEINELKTKFIATVSHEFRTPLAALFSSTQMIQRYAHKWSEEKLNDHYERIDSTVKYLTQLLDDVLAISRADREFLTNNPEEVNVENFVKLIFEHFDTDEIKLHNLVFINELDKPTIIVDKKLLNHIILNLLTNAIKYSPNGGNVELTISSDNENIKIMVSDNGLGISEDEIKHIFDAFYRATNSVGINGSGLGLNIIQRSLDVLGGNISVESKVNEGTTFTIKIPNVE